MLNVSPSGPVTGMGHIVYYICTNCIQGVPACVGRVPMSYIFFQATPTDGEKASVYKN